MSYSIATITSVAACDLLLAWAAKEKAVWLNQNEIHEALKKSYENIKLLFEEEHIL